MQNKEEMYLANLIEHQRKLADPTSVQVGGSHYKMDIQPIEFIMRNEIPYAEGNVVKYVTRHRSKNGLQDLRKAKHYLEFIAKYVYGEQL